MNSLMGVRIAGMGAFVPSSVVSNDDLTQLVETSDEWIASRTGIRTRHVVSGNETVADLAIEASRQAIAQAGIDPASIDLIIAACSTPDTIYPALAAQVQYAVGAVNAGGFDVSLACTGFVASLITASQFIRSGMAKTALVVAADVHSRYVDWYDRNTCVLFGDGSGAAILRAEPAGHSAGLLAAEMFLDGSKGKELTLFVNQKNCPLVSAKEDKNPYVYMNGREMFKFAVGLVPQSLVQTVEKANLSLNDIDYFFLHQANIRIVQAMCEKLAIPEEKLLVNVDKYGNTSAASIPLVLNQAIREGKIQPGQKIVLCGFGAGAAWATMVFEWLGVGPEAGQAFSQNQAKPERLTVG